MQLHLHLSLSFCHFADDLRHHSSPAAVEPSCPVIKEAIRECVDEYHSVVASLVKADYSLEDSIDAVMKCGTLEDAMHYLEMAAAEKDQDSGSLIPMSQEQHISMKPSQEDNTQGNWCVFYVGTIPCTFEMYMLLF